MHKVRHCDDIDKKPRDFRSLTAELAFAFFVLSEPSLFAAVCRHSSASGAIRRLFPAIRCSSLRMQPEQSGVSSWKNPTIKIYIPGVIEEGELNETSEEPPVTSGTGTVLLMEDNDMVRNMTALMLQKIGYTVLIAETPQAALSLCEKKDTPIDLLITDVVMPVMSGKELRDRIKAVLPEIKVLFMSGYTSDVIVHRGLLREDVNFIQKPFSMQQFAQKVRDAMESR